RISAPTPSRSARLLPAAATTARTAARVRATARSTAPTCTARYCPRIRGSPTTSFCWACATAMATSPPCGRYPTAPRSALIRPPPRRRGDTAVSSPPLNPPPGSGPSRRCGRLGAQDCLAHRSLRRCLIESDAPDAKATRDIYFDEPEVTVGACREGNR